MLRVRGTHSLLCNEWTSTHTDVGGQGRPPGGGHILTHVLKQDSVHALTTLFLCRYSQKIKAKPSLLLMWKLAVWEFRVISWRVIEGAAQEAAQHRVNSIVFEASQTEVSASNWQCKKQVFREPQSLIL